MKTTEFLGLNVPELADSPPDITKFSENYPKIDANAKLVSSQINNLAAYAVASGTNAYTAIIAGITALTEGFSIKIKFTNANTEASTLNINGLGAKSILKGNGNALSSGNIKAGQICNLVYNGLNFQLLGEGGEYGTATASDVLSGKTVGADSGLVNGTMPNRGAVNQNLITEGQEYTILQGYHNGLGKIKAVIIGLVASVIKAGTTVGGILGTFTSDATAVATDLLSTKTAYKNGTKLTGTMANNGSQSATITTQGGTKSIPVGYTTGGIVTASFANLSAENVKKDVNIGGVVGMLIPSLDFNINRFSASMLTLSSSNSFHDYGIFGSKLENPNMNAPFNTSNVLIKIGSWAYDGQIKIECSKPVFLHAVYNYSDMATKFKGETQSYLNSRCIFIIYNPNGATITISNNSGKSNFSIVTYLN